MGCSELINIWLQEEKRAFQGWDFSYISKRTTEEALPWCYKEKVLSYINNETTMLDMGTGGGEFLLSLSPPRGRTYATEAYPPNYELCKEKLPAYGVDVRQVFNDNALPFEDSFFDLVINRHEAFSADEVHRILKPGGIFITQQVGGMNNRELANSLLDVESTMVDANFNLKYSEDVLAKAGLTILNGSEYFPMLKFYDIGALVYFAKIIEWEFPNFSVEKCYERLCLLQEKLDKDGYIQSMEHRFFIMAKK